MLDLGGDYLLGERGLGGDDSRDQGGKREARPILRGAAVTNPFTLYASSIARRFHLRLAEWTLAMSILLVGVVFLMPGETFELTPYAVLRSIGEERTWGLALLILGLARLTILTINGALPRGSPHLRGALAALSASVWAILFASYVASAVPSAMVAMTGPAIVTEFFIIFRAAGSARVEDEVRGGRNGRH